jgi:hypothetical protein
MNVCRIVNLQAPTAKTASAGVAGAVIPLSTGNSLEWICRVKAAWIKPYCRVPQLLREKP